MALPCNGPCTASPRVLSCAQSKCGCERAALRVGRSEQRLSSHNASVDLPPIPPSVPVARHIVLELLRAWKVPHDLDGAALLVTELVSNVVDHVQGEAVLTLELGVSDDWLRIAVVDGSSVRPVVQQLAQARPRE